MNQTQPAGELKPCPICHKIEHLKSVDRSGHYQVGGPFIQKWRVSCDGCCVDLFAPTELEATQRWNTRQPCPRELALEKALQQTANELRTVRMSLALLAGATYPHSDIQNFRLLFYSVERITQEINLEQLNERVRKALSPGETKEGK